MKLAVATFAFAITFATGATASAACSQLENQFFGTVRNVQHVTNAIGQKVCTYQLDVGGTPSGVCPLTNQDASALTLIDGSCALKAGDKTSGVIVTKTWIE